MPASYLQIIKLEAISSLSSSLLVACLLALGRALLAVASGAFSGYVRYCCGPLLAVASGANAELQMANDWGRARAGGNEVALWRL
jgi:hypothetical protein